MNDAQKVRATIVEYLMNKELYEEIDVTLMNELVFNVELADRCKADCETEGYRVKLNKTGAPKWNTNKSLEIYQNALKNITNILQSMSLTPRERNRVKMALNDPDNFDKIMGE